MNKEELFKKFQEMFPNWADHAMSYKKIGHHVLAIKFVFDANENKEYEESRVFLYQNPNNWHFGTKLYRKRPGKKTENEAAADSMERSIAMGR